MRSELELEALEMRRRYGHANSRSRSSPSPIKIVRLPITTSIALSQWRSTDRTADFWESVRQRMNPVPSTKEFLAMCDKHEARALQYGSWDATDLAEYVKASLLVNAI
jgi:hypothetical protein